MHDMGRALLAAADGESLTAARSLLVYDARPFVDFFIGTLCSFRANYPDRLLFSLAKQLCWGVGDCFEEVVTSSVRLMDMFGTPTLGCGTDPSKGAVVPRALSCYWVPGASAHVAKELGHYLQCTRAVMTGAQFLSIAGPDDTKVGTDLNLSMAYMHHPVKRLSCVCIAQVERG
jgi:hypothetical protein